MTDGHSASPLAPVAHKPIRSYACRHFGGTGSVQTQKHCYLRYRLKRNAVAISATSSCLPLQAMAPRKGLSFDEKRDRLMELFAQTADFFTLKELEKIAPKRKGIVSQSVKEVLQSLVDDNLVNTDKCGVQTVFWALPSEASQKRHSTLHNLQQALQRKTAEKAQLTDDIQQLECGREDTQERRHLFERISQLQEKDKQLDQQLDRFTEFDPQQMQRLKERTRIARESTNRWVDNIFNCQSWAVNKFHMDKREFGKQFGIPEELDYLEQ